MAGLRRSFRKEEMLVSVDEVCESYARRKVKIAVRILDAENDMILIEGDAKALEFLGNLFLAQASAGDCGFEIAPNSAGSAFFTPNSTLGIYIHRVPCTSHK
jgi:hypothetical protein